MPISEDLDRFLSEKRIVDQANRRKGCISPSSLGQCYRRQFWTRKQEKESDPIDLQTLRVFEAGHMTHKLIQSMYLPECREVEVILGDDVYGHADLVFDDCVVDIKSCGTFQFKKFAKMTPDEFATEKPDYVLQVTCYATALGKPLGFIALVSKEDWAIREIELPVKTYSGWLEAELRRLREIWVANELPAATPRLYNGKECAYCSHRTHCEITEGTKAF